tara:strand:+ start:841 stop:3039 length:2199 start_codon:yes stop_codon:yes gene_type:complete
MAKSLSDIVGLVASGDANILEEQEKSNATLESIDRNMKAFLAGQKNSRLDDLENSREKKRSSSMGGLPSAAVVGGGLAAGIGAVTGDSINPLALIAGYAGLKAALKLTGKGLKGISKLTFRLAAVMTTKVRGINTQLDEARVKLLKDIEDFEKATKKAQDKLNRARKMRQLATADVSRLRAVGLDEANDPRSKTNQEKLRKAEVAESRRRAIEDGRRIALEKMERAKANAKLNANALEEAKNVEAAKRAKRLRQIKADIKAGELEFKQQQDLARRIAKGVDRTNDPRSRANTDIAQQNEVKATRMRVGSVQAKARLAAESGDKVNDPRSVQNQDSARLAEAAENKERVKLNQDLTARSKARNLMGQADAQFRQVEAFKQAGLRSNLLNKSGALAADDSGRFIKNAEAKKRLSAAGLTPDEIANLETAKASGRVKPPTGEFGDLTKGLDVNGPPRSGFSKVGALDKGLVGAGVVTGDPFAMAEAGLRIGGATGTKLATNTAGKAVAQAATKVGLALGGMAFNTLLLTVMPNTMADGTLSGLVHQIARDIFTFMVQGGVKDIKKILLLVNDLRTYKMGYEDLYSMSDEDIKHLTIAVHTQHNKLMVADTEAGELYRETGQTQVLNEETGEMDTHQAPGTVQKSLRNKITFGRFGLNSAEMSKQAYSELNAQMDKNIAAGREAENFGGNTPKTSNNTPIVVQNVNNNGNPSGTNTNTSGMSSIDLNASAVPGFAQ